MCTDDDVRRPWVVKRDKKELGRYKTENEAFAAILWKHAAFCSVSHALAHEGYEIINEDV